VRAQKAVLGVWVWQNLIGKAAGAFDDLAGSKFKKEPENRVASFGHYASLGSPHREAFAAGRPCGLVV
jgi:hypothetical protein